MTMNRDVIALAEAIARAGGRALLVGGFVRDHALEQESKDYDFEIYGLSLSDLETTLATFGEVIAVGRAFGVLRVKGFEMDFSLPRRDNKTGKGHRGFVVDLDPTLSFAEAARRRDLTINSMGLDPLTDELIDPYGGQTDLKAGVLRATDASQFSEDPLRGLRVAQFASRFDMHPDEELIAVCRDLDLSELPAERLCGEFQKLMLKGRRPSVGIGGTAARRGDRPCARPGLGDHWTGARVRRHAPGARPGRPGPHPFTHARGPRTRSDLHGLRTCP